ncbi:MAG: FliI/YscN family ATPase [Hydrogenothermaceae bacterium]|nr:FliI/YscN family ATPase [Hydrogenothermaceae bacterium]
MKLKERLRSYPKYKIVGKITKVVGNTIEASLKGVKLGSVVYIDKSIECEVVGFKDGKAILMSYDTPEGIGLSSTVESSYLPLKIGVGDDLLGAVIDPFGKPLNRENITYSNYYYIKQESVNPIERERIKEPLDTGIRVINSILTVGKGQRVGIFAGAGIGKSTLLGMICRYTDADVNVIALIGERGREVREFIEDNLGEEGLKKSVVIVSTSDTSPLLKIRAVTAALAIAKYFSNKGKNVLFMLDSLSRVAMAQREIGLSVGEPPTTKGYTPSVFTLLPKIIEQAGNFKGKGSITGIYTVLVEGDKIDADPIADAAVSFLDGHIVLSRDLANKRIFPAVDIVKSISRLTPQIVPAEMLKYQSKVIELESKYREVEDMINLGLYKEGTSKEIDLSIKMHPFVLEFIKQDINEKINFERSIEDLKNMINYYKQIGGDV